MKKRLFILILITFIALFPLPVCATGSMATGLPDSFDRSYSVDGTNIQEIIRATFSEESLEAAIAALGKDMRPDNYRVDVDAFILEFDADTNFGKEFESTEKIILSDHPTFIFRYSVP